MGYWVLLLLFLYIYIIFLPSLKIYSGKIVEKEKIFNFPRTEEKPFYYFFFYYKINYLNTPSNFSCCDWLVGLKMMLRQFISYVKNCSRKRKCDDDGEKEG